MPAYVANDVFLLGGPGSEPTEGEQEFDRTTLAASFKAQTFGEGTEGPSTLMMTGPNYSGKSVFLKQVSDVDVLLKQPP